MSDQDVSARRGRPRRPHGTGSLIERRDRAGRVTYYGQWRLGDRLVKRRIGPKRVPSSSEGLTRRQAEAALRRLMSEARPELLATSRVDLAQAGAAYIDNAESVMGRKPTTIRDYRVILRQLVEHFGTRPLAKITPDEITAYAKGKARTHSTKTISNHLNLLNAIFVLGMRRGWAASNPAQLVDRPRAESVDRDLRFLSPEDVEALLRSVPDDAEGPRDRALYATAAWAGLRQGELAGLRWRDVDWPSGVIRVRQAFTHGAFSTPKSRRSIRGVPMFDRLGAELERWHQQSNYADDDDLVFAHPHSGSPFDASHVRKRFHAALAAAGVRRVRFHDLRHTFGTQMAAAGCPLRILQGYMGHASYVTTEVYADFAPDLSRGAEWAERAFGTATPSGATAHP